MAWALLACVVLGLVGAALVAPWIYIIDRVPIEKPPDVLRETARDILRTAGLSDPPADSVSQFGVASDYFGWMRKTDRSASYAKTPPAAVIEFWYRQSPRPLVGRSFPGRLTADEPTLSVSGILGDSVSNVFAR